MDERAIRINEMERMETFCQNHGIGNDNTENPFRVQIRRRLRELDPLYGTPAAAPKPFLVAHPDAGTLAGAKGREVAPVVSEASKAPSPFAAQQNELKPDPRAGKLAGTH